ncbi:flagellar export chaperone FliS [Luteibacter aegosomatissinici]|uniref:flagellar export chaperone FliS n=1 Tax=Luteibacter aegosomatissinici TaxID=2911539 RepID=UPI001FFA0490|nr:flagellar export chaperone FliS [Luteibacter aegosomatissinici]UPG93492.1 flagellar export chaperone FliS [Luteibacter aegosomatissinici]
MALGYSRGAGAYQQIRTGGGIESADAHGLITLLMDGALERIRLAVACIATGNVASRGEAISKAIEIIGGLQAALNHDIETTLVERLDALYDYMSRRLLFANLHADTLALEEVATLLGQVRDSWVAIPAEDRQAVGAGA